MRFAWERENSTDGDTFHKGFTNPVNRVLFFIYNLVYWLPIVLTVFKVVDYRTGFIGFALIILVRLVANLYANNFLTAESFENFPFRSP